MKHNIRNNNMLLTLLLLVAAMVMPKMAWAQIIPSKPSGKGTAASPYQIGSAAELYWFAALVNGDTNVEGVAAADKAACAELTQNIEVNSGVLQSDGSLAADASGFTAWTPISTDDENPYTGTFDGKGYTISGLYFNNTNNSNLIGLFGYVGSGSKICNVGIVDSYFNGGSGIGGVCGYCISGGEITNCYNTGTVIGTGVNIGGVCGYNNGTITDCYNTGNVSGTSTSNQEACVGGVCGCNSGYTNMSTITRSYNSGKVSGGYCVGGVCGANGYNGPAKTINCYNTGEVTGTNDYVGGICGYNGASGSRIENCYNSAAVSGSSYVGSVCGLNHAVITTCYYYLTTESELSGVGESGTNAVSNAHGKTADQFNSGEVCYLLNASEEVFTWRQNLNSDNLPVLDESHGKVYASAPCPAHFSNSPSDLAATEHSYKDGVCEVCGEVDIRPEMIDGVYQLTTSEQLYWFAEQVNGDNKDLNAVLLNDIIVNSGVVSASTEDAKVWKPIGNNIAPYTGTFDGKGYTISGLYFNDTRESSKYVGLFGKIGSGGSVSNVNVTNSYFNGDEHVGGICGRNEGSIANCHVQGILSAKYYAGGVCGSNEGTITNCYNTGTVSGVTFGFGGVCGQNYGTIKNCYNTGTVSCPNYKIGGVCGSNSKTITNCYYLSGTADGGILGSDVTGSAESKTETQFKSGEVALLLNGGTTDGSQAWYQNISAQSGDACPVLKSTEGNTVYGGYKHGGNTGKFSNTESVISEGYIHLHAYNPSAADEANGNHDKSYRGEYIWADNDDKTNATVTATFTCSVCGKVVEPEMTVVHDDEHTNTPAACTEVGYHYFKTSHAFEGAIFTDSYTQTVPALGHKMNIRTFNEYKKIYSNQCQRENCGYIGYYATSDGSVEAKLEDGIYKVKSFTLVDATTYDNRAEFTVNDFTYARTFEDTGWTTWYVPFDLVLTEELCNSYSFSRINNVHRYDDNDDGTPDRTEVEAFNQLVGVTLKANYPYLVKAKTDGNLHMDLMLNSVTPAKAEDNGCFCQSVDYKYSFTGTYSGLSEVGTGSEDPYSLQSNGEWTHQSEISPMRHYLTVTSRNAAPLSSLARISLVVIGDETLTGTVIPYSQEKRQTETYDLSGRLTHSNQRGIVIRNGKKIIQK